MAYNFIFSFNISLFDDSNSKDFKNIGNKAMCKKLKELTGMSPAKILETYYAGSKSYAVDMKSIMKSIGVTVSSFDFSKLSNRLDHNILGAIILLNDELAVLVSDKCSQAEQRFILAHELGHCCLHGSTLKTTKIECASNFDSNDPHEHAADVFADQLLLPTKEFIEVCDMFDTQKKDITILSEVFCVPRECVIRRLKELDLNN